MPGRMMQRKAGLPRRPTQQAWAAPSGEGEASTLSGSTDHHAPFASISSRPVCALVRWGTGRQSRRPQQSRPCGERSPVYQSWAAAGGGGGRGEQRDQDGRGAHVHLRDRCRQP